jgi:hypothetical protein
MAVELPGALPVVGAGGVSGRAAAAGFERELAAALVATRSGLDTLLTKGDGGRDAVFGFPERALAGLGWVNFR